LSTITIQANDWSQYIVCINTKLCFNALVMQLIQVSRRRNVDEQSLYLSLVIRIHSFPECATRKISFCGIDRLMVLRWWLFVCAD